MKAKVTVIYPVTIEVDVDESQVSDDEYILKKRNEAKDLADQMFDCSSIDSVIHSSDVDQLIE